MLKLLSPKTKLFILVGVLLIFTVIFIVIYRKGKNAGATNLNLVSGNADTGGALVSEAEIKQLAQQIKADLGGINFIGHSPDLYVRVLSLSDTDLTRLYNQFNMAYQKESGESLVNWVANEYAAYGTTWQGTQNALLSRFAKLNFI